MGVQGLWELLAPVGRRVSVETLAGKKVAIDASIWLVQFIKAMRDEKGEMVRNAHLIGFFRRICKLLFLRTRPVFVFDGGTPALKRRTVAARRRQRENATAKIRKTAEKLLLNHLKAKKLEELAAELKEGRCKEALKGKSILADGKDGKVSDGTERDVHGGLKQEELDEMLAASIAAEEEELLIGKESLSANQPPCEDEFDEDEEEEMAIPIGSDHLDPTVLASLPPSMQLDLLVQMRERLMAENRQKYQKIKKSPSKFSELQIQSYLKTVAFRREIDQVQRNAAGKGPEGLQTFRIASEANREFVFSSSFNGDKRNFTPTSSERPANAINSGLNAKNESLPVSTSSGASSSHQLASAQVNQDESTEDFSTDIGTYIDERGRTRVSRVRGLGLRMTRDLQHNLNLILEHDKNQNNTGEASKLPAYPSGNDASSSDHSLGFSEMKDTSMEVSFSVDDADIGEDEVFCGLVSGKSMFPITSQSYVKDLSAKDSDSDDDWEDGEVKNKSTTNDRLDKENITNSVSKRLREEEAEIQVAIEKSLEDLKRKSQFDQSFGARKDILQASYPSDADWEDGQFEITSISNDGYDLEDRSKSVSIGLQEEEGEIQVAIQKSLEDLKQKSCGLEPSSERNAINAPSHSQKTNEILQNNSPDDADWEEGQVEVKSISNDGLDLENRAKSISIGLQEDGEVQVPIHKSLENLKLKSQDYVSSSERNDVSLVSLSLKTNEILQTDSPERKCPPKENNGLNMEVLKSFEDSEQKLKVPESSSKNTAFSSSSLLLETNEILLTASRKSELLSKASALKDPVSVKENSETVLFSCPNHDHDDKEFQQKLSESITFLDDEKEIVREKNAEKQPDKHHGDLEVEGVILSTKEGSKYNSLTHPSLNSQSQTLGSALDEELAQVNRERRDLGEEQKRLERNAESVNSEMFSECQELLQMFGLPFIIAPMEAEAQCAYMEMMNLVDGIVTDDSDAFLFGAQSVFKNIFDERKYVETYLMKDIENELGLSREKLIRMALLLGSDYTEGVSGIGIVNAIEVVNAFPEEDGLKEFREWVESPDPTLFEKLRPHSGNKVRKKSKKSNNGDADEYALDQEEDLSETKQTFMEKHRNVSKNWHIPPAFPSAAVTSAYINPQVDGSTEPFSWGKPDLPLLRRLCWEKFGWAQQKADELLIPVLKEYNKHETQLRLEAFYTFNERFAKIRSQRIKKAVKGITGKNSRELMEDEKVEGESKAKKKRKNPTVSETKPKRKRSDGATRRRGGRKKLSDESNSSSEDDCPLDVASTSSELRRSTRLRAETQRTTPGSARVNLPKEESQNSSGQLFEDQQKVNNKTPIIDDSQPFQGQYTERKVNAQDDAVAEHLRSGGGFCLGEDEEEKEKEENKEKVEEKEEIGEGVNREEDGFSFTAMPSLRRKRR